MIECLLYKSIFVLGAAVDGLEVYVIQRNDSAWDNLTNGEFTHEVCILCRAEYVCAWNVGGRPSDGPQQDQQRVYSNPSLTVLDRCMFVQGCA